MSFLSAINPVSWFTKLFGSNTIIAGAVRHILALVTTLLVAKYGLSASDAQEWITSTLKLLPAILAALDSLVSKA